MNKNLLRVIVYVVGFSILFILDWFAYQIFPSLKFENPILLLIIRTIALVFIAFIVLGTIQFIFRKYGIPPPKPLITFTPKTRKITIIILVVLSFMLLFGPYLFFNGNLPF